MSGSLRILYIAYPLLTVSPESAGGAEQVLWTLERELAARGIETTVAASTGSQVSGQLLPTGAPCCQLDDFERRNREHQEKILGSIRMREREGKPFDLVHDMSGSFWPRANEVDAPVLATVHLPRNFYASRLFENVPVSVSFNCVSHSQARSFADLPGLQGVVTNGIALDYFSVKSDPGLRKGALWLGRICREKAPHLAIDIARRAGMPLTIAGQVYPFSYHQQYFEREISPHLRDPNVRYVESPSAEVKHRLLHKAQVLLLTSQVDETSSLVAMEAAASGTPVIAFARGALPDVVCNGVTGFIVDGIEEAVRAMERIGRIDAGVCVLHAGRNFSSAAMAGAYLSIYSRMVRAARTAPRVASG